MTKKIAVLPGDGIGTEIVAEALKVLERELKSSINELNYFIDFHLFSALNSVARWFESLRAQRP